MSKATVIAVVAGVSAGALGLAAPAHADEYDFVSQIDAYSQRGGNRSGPGVV